MRINVNGSVYEYLSVTSLSSFVSDLLSGSDLDGRRIEVKYDKFA